MTQRPSTQDLDEIFLKGQTLWEKLAGKRFFISGGTGFFGRWLLETFDYLHRCRGIETSLTVLSRSPERFCQKAPHFLNHPRIDFLSGDITGFPFPEGHFDYIIHAATETDQNAHQPLAILDPIVAGTRRMLDFALQSGASRFLLTSSGAVYGRQPPELPLLPETHPGAPDPCSTRSAYGEGKRIAEQLCAIYHQQHGIECTIARCFAFVGPYLPLESQFAVGNFIGNALRGEPVIIKGDGTPYRSYLYATDLIVWLLTILLNGQPMQPYHVGSNHPISIADLAHLVARLPQPPIRVEIQGTPRPGTLPERYVPDTQFTQNRLELQISVPIKEALQRTWAFHTAQT